MFYPSKAKIKSIITKNKLLVPIYKNVKEFSSVRNSFAVIANIKDSFLLESAMVNSTTGKYSFFGIGNILVFESKGNQIIITKNNKKVKYNGNPLRELKKLLKKYKSVKTVDLPCFRGGAVGYFGYDVCHLFENLPKTTKDDINIPDIYFVFTDTIVAFNHTENKVKIISHVYPLRDFDKAYNQAVERIKKIEKKIKTKRPKQSIEFNIGKEIRSTCKPAGFVSMVKKAKNYIRKGDIFQANLSQRLSVDIKAEPFKVYETLSMINPSPFACFLNFKDFNIISSSPERLISLNSGIVNTRPIAGTIQRGKTKKEETIYSKNLMLSEKDKAEHIMLVDLERNDIGRVCEYGSISVNELMVLEKYSHVIHIVSNIKGRLYKGKDAFDLIRAVFPGGTITGTPKVRCMEIIDELEPVNRNIYTGSIGYIDFNGDMDLNIVIRTFVMKNNKAYIQVGAGIVADSEPVREYYETLYKAEALIKTLNQMRKSSPVKKGH